MSNTDTTSVGNIDDSTPCTIPSKPTTIHPDHENKFAFFEIIPGVSARCGDHNLGVADKQTVARLNSMKDRTERDALARELVGEYAWRVANTVAKLSTRGPLGPLDLICELMGDDDLTK